MDVTCPSMSSEFLSTPSARRATCSAENMSRRMTYFYPRPPRGGRQSASTSWSTPSRFLSTPSARRATDELYDERAAVVISIHALREEGDL